MSRKVEGWMASGHQIHFQTRGPVATSHPELLLKQDLTDDEFQNAIEVFLMLRYWTLDSNEKLNPQIYNRTDFEKLALILDK